MAKVFFHYIDAPFSFKHKKFTKLYLEALFQKEQKIVERIDYLFCSDTYLLKMNRQFLSHDYYTDVITFDLSETKEIIKGEIYISVERVKENAKNLNVPFEKELKRVLFHGALHLCGYKDKTKREIKAMRNKEDFYLMMFHVKP